jgi:hypothetical protein
MPNDEIEKHPSLDDYIRKKLGLEIAINILKKQHNSNLTQNT